jgi:hypothetical protein
MIIHPAVTNMLWDKVVNKNLEEQTATCANLPHAMSSILEEIAALA